MSRLIEVYACDVVWCGPFAKLVSANYIHMYETPHIQNTTEQCCVQCTVYSHINKFGVRAFMWLLKHNAFLY